MEVFVAEIVGGKSAVGSCKLPTGVVHEESVLKDIVFREMAGPEEDLFANRKMSVSKKFTLVMQNCIQKFGDIEDRHKINSLVLKMVETDRFYLLIQLRILSVDQILNFDTICPSCKQSSKVQFDLSGVCINNPPDAKNLLKDVKLKSGSVVRIKVADARAEEVIEKAANEKSAMSLALMARVESIDDKPASLSDVIQMSMRDRKVLRDAIDELEGDLDDQYQTTCSHCGHEYSGSLPLESSDFLSV